MQDVAGDMFGQFVACVKQQLEDARSESASETSHEDVKAVAVVPLVLRSLWRSILRPLRRILRRPPPT